MSEWISVNNAFPECEETNFGAGMKPVLIWDGRIIHMGYYWRRPNGYCWDCSGYALHAQDVTHWMPLPKPPKEEL